VSLCVGATTLCALCMHPIEGTRVQYWHESKCGRNSACLKRSRTRQNPPIFIGRCRGSAQTPLRWRYNTLRPPCASNKGTRADSWHCIEYGASSVCSNTTGAGTKMRLGAIDMAAALTACHPVCATTLCALHMYLLEGSKVLFLRVIAFATISMCSKPASGGLGI